MLKYVIIQITAGLRGVLMGKIGVKAAIFGLFCNFALFLTKLYIGISTNSLAIYCDSINNLGDMLSCAVAFFGFIFVMKCGEKKGERIQSLCSFVIGIIVAVTGFYCLYSGLERIIYPLPVSYSSRYALLILATALVKLLMGGVYTALNRRSSSPVLKVMILDSFLDFGITLAAIFGFYLVKRLNFAVDGVFGITIGTIISISSIKTVCEQTKKLIAE